MRNRRGGDRRPGFLPSLVWGLDTALWPGVSTHRPRATQASLLGSGASFFSVRLHACAEPRIQISLGSPNFTDRFGRRYGAVKGAGRGRGDPLRYSRRSFERPVFLVRSDAFEPAPRAAEPVPGRL